MTALKNMCGLKQHKRRNTDDRMRQGESAYHRNNGVIEDQHRHYNHVSDVKNLERQELHQLHCRSPADRKTIRPSAQRVLEVLYENPVEGDQEVRRGSIEMLEA